ncbi:unnamed protein product, partial [Urochloa humidicola]
KGEESHGIEQIYTIAYLIFSPSVSSEFKLVQLCRDFGLKVNQVYTYSSESGVWSSRTVECCSLERVERTTLMEKGRYAGLFAGQKSMVRLVFLVNLRGTCIARVDIETVWDS